MRRTALFLLLCAALPAPAFAQAAAAATGTAQSTAVQPGEDVTPMPGVRANWSLKAPKKKKPGQGPARQVGQQTAKQDVEGPAVPPPMRQKIPPAKPKQATAQRQSNHVNATPMINSIINKQRRN